MNKDLLNGVKLCNFNIELKHETDLPLYEVSKNHIKTEFTGLNLI